MGEAKKDSTSIWWVVAFVLFVGYSLHRCLGCDGHVDDENFVGTYEIVDKAKQTFILTLKEDKSATMTIKGTNQSYYCSWDYWVLSNESYVKISFSDDPPTLVFDGGVAVSMWGPQIRDEWLYFDNSAREAKNPKQRLPIKKIK